MNRAKIEKNFKPSIKTKKKGIMPSAGHKIAFEIIFHHNQHLFEALIDVCDFTALETDMIQIIDAVEKDKAEMQKLDILDTLEQLRNGIK
jgi:hypothetical protein